MSSIITKADVIAKVKQLHKKHYYSYGYMIHTVPDENSEHYFNKDNLKWYQTFNHNVSNKVPLLSLDAKLSLNGYTFKMRFDRPLVKDERYEFESYFGFGGHCDGYNPNRTVMCFAETKDETINIDDLLVKDQTASDTVDADYINYVITVLILGGYVKFWNAIYEFEKWCVDAGILNTCNRDMHKVITHILDNMECDYI